MSDERLRKLENNYSKMEEKQDQILNQVKELKENTINQEQMELANEKLIQKALQQADDRYASKRVEVMVFGGAGIALAYLVNEVLSII